MFAVYAKTGTAWKLGKIRLPSLVLEVCLYEQEISLFSVISWWPQSAVGVKKVFKAVLFYCLGSKIPC